MTSSMVHFSSVASFLDDIDVGWARCGRRNDQGHGKDWIGYACGGFGMYISKIFKTPLLQFCDVNCPHDFFPSLCWTS